MNPRKLLARLGPRSPALIRVMHGHHHTAASPSDTLSELDISAALTRISNPLGRAVYSHLWIPGVAESLPATRALVDRAARLLVRVAHRKGWPVPPAGQLVKPIPGWDDGAHPARHFARRIAVAVLSEMADRNDCPSCLGYGRRLATPKNGVGLTLEDCPTCDATGIVALGHTRRAKLLRVRKSLYFTHAQRPYRFLASYLRNLEHRAASDHWKGMQDGVAHQ